MSSELDALYTKEHEVNGKRHSYNDFEKIAFDGSMKGVESVNDIFDRADKIKAVYDAADEKKKWLDANGGKEPISLLNDGGSYLDYKKASQGYRAVDKKLRDAQEACSRYDIEFGDDGVPTSVSRKLVDSQLAWKDEMMPDIQRIIELEGEEYSDDDE